MYEGCEGGGGGAGGGGAGSAAAAKKGGTLGPEPLPAPAPETEPPEITPEATPEATPNRKGAPLDILNTGRTNFPINRIVGFDTSTT
jgi:hypothetical protein